MKEKGIPYPCGQHLSLRVDSNGSDALVVRLAGMHQDQLMALSVLLTLEVLWCFLQPFYP